MPLDRVMGCDDQPWNKGQADRHSWTAPPEPKPIPPCCGTCAFFIPGAEGGYGRCRKKPPTREVSKWTFFGLRRLWEYPSVGADLEACGEYKRVPEPSDPDATYQVEEYTGTR